MLPETFCVFILVTVGVGCSGTSGGGDGGGNKFKLKDGSVRFCP